MIIRGYSGFGLTDRETLDARSPAAAIERGATNEENMLRSIAAQDTRIAVATEQQRVPSSRTPTTTPSTDLINPYVDQRVPSSRTPTTTPSDMMVSDGLIDPYKPSGDEAKVDPLPPAPAVSSSGMGMGVLIAGGLLAYLLLRK